MGYYLMQIAYTPMAWAAMVQQPQDRMAAIRHLVEQVGGTLVDSWLSFGEYDAVTVLQAPDHVSAAAVSMASAAGGALKDVKLTPLITHQEGLEAMRKAGNAGYLPPTAAADASGDGE
jgi:uncharacterized protein with GYD domain